MVGRKELKDFVPAGLPLPSGPDSQARKKMRSLCLWREKKLQWDEEKKRGWRRSGVLNWMYAAIVLAPNCGLEIELSGFDSLLKRITSRSHHSERREQLIAAITHIQ